MGRRPLAPAVSWNCKAHAAQQQNMALPQRQVVTSPNSSTDGCSPVHLSRRMPPPALLLRGKSAPRALPPSWACGMLTCITTLIRPDMHASRRGDQSLAQGDLSPHSLQPCAAAIRMCSQRSAAYSQTLQLLPLTCKPGWHACAFTVPS